MEDSTSNNTEANFPEYSIVGKELTTFILQPGFVESIIPESLSFDTIPKVYRYIFRNNKEYAIALWNGVPIRLSYQDDIPFLITELVTFLVDLRDGATSTSLEVKTINLEFSINANCSLDVLTLTGNFKKVAGSYEKALQSVNMLKMDIQLFLNEWKLLLDQLQIALERSKTNITSKAAKQTVQQLQLLNHSIKVKGVLYL